MGTLPGQVICMAETAVLMKSLCRMYYQPQGKHPGKTFLTAGAQEDID